ncbi:hypothetical protein CI109_100400 [Kwoniella shandongensis]|uniref:Uncharacterized protein n=1 Tax=Kwoniella shandongensis TaxID=1734106 RepID=A0A5M6C3U1_9TREE|nr:uncharacterized protein CI109_001757 [Kwoniella shandongensis]KAA5529817.1 hypothetical protein CI109_001757 [Kwoniella shandongensis]
MQAYQSSDNVAQNPHMTMGRRSAAPSLPSSGIATTATEQVYSPISKRALAYQSSISYGINTPQLPTIALGESTYTPNVTGLGLDTGNGISYGNSTISSNNINAITAPYPSPWIGQQNVPTPDCDYTFVAPSQPTIPGPSTTPSSSGTYPPAYGYGVNHFPIYPTPNSILTSGYRPLPPSMPGFMSTPRYNYVDISCAAPADVFGLVSGTTSSEQVTCPAVVPDPFFSNSNSALLYSVQSTNASNSPSSSGGHLLSSGTMSNSSHHPYPSQSVPILDTNTYHSSPDVSEEVTMTQQPFGLQVEDSDGEDEEDYLPSIPEKRARGRKGGRGPKGHVKPSSALSTSKKSGDGEGKKRTRIQQACECCRIRKHKCSGGARCERCITKGLKCVYSNAPRQRGPNKSRGPVPSMPSHESLLVTEPPSAPVRANGSGKRRLHADVEAGLMTKRRRNHSVSDELTRGQNRGDATEQLKFKMSAHLRSKSFNHPGLSGNRHQHQSSVPSTTTKVPVVGPSTAALGGGYLSATSSSTSLTTSSSASSGYAFPTAPLPISSQPNFPFSSTGYDPSIGPSNDHYGLGLSLGPAAPTSMGVSTIVTATDMTKQDLSSMGMDFPGTLHDGEEENWSTVWARHVESERGGESTALWRSRSGSHRFSMPLTPMEGGEGRAWLQ